MKISELVAKLQAHPNQEAKVNFNLNVINSEVEEFDEEAQIEIFNEDSFYEEFIEIKVFPKIMKDEADIENNIHTFLTEDFSNITIEIDVENGIYVSDSEGGTLREIEYSKDWLKNHSREEIINEISLKLRKIL